MFQLYNNECYMTDTVFGTGFATTKSIHFKLIEEMFYYTYFSLKVTSKQNLFSKALVAFLKLEIGKNKVLTPLWSQMTSQPQ